MSDIIVYYAVSPVHIRNIQLLRPHLEARKVRIAYEKASPWLREGSANDMEMIGFAPDDMPEALWQGRVGVVVFSAIQPRLGPIALLAAALEREIPTVAIEESSQIALNQGRINNYVLPVDRVLTASEYERKGMIKAGLPARRFEAVGWPFYGGRIGRIDERLKKERKEALGLDGRRPVAALTLTGLHDAGESPTVRRRQLSLSAQGLPDGYQLVIKPHPIESRETLMPFVKECAPHATVLEGPVLVEDMLDATDVLLNRGASQVCFEALFREVPVVVLDTGIWTPFHAVPERVAADPASLRRIVGELEDAADWLASYDVFFQEHVILPPDQARVAVCTRITEIADAGERDPCVAEQLFELALFRAWTGDMAGARRTLQRLDYAVDYPIGPLGRLIECGANHDDLNQLQAYFGIGFHAHLLRSLWIDQLAVTRQDPTAADCEWMQQFPPDLQPVWFVARMRRWAIHLARRGMGAAARDYADRVERDFIHIPGVVKLKRDVNLYLQSPVGSMRVILWEWAVARLEPIRAYLRL